MAPQRLNIFQTLQRHWDELHPYNAGQILQLKGTGDPSRLTEAFHQTLHDLKLGQVSVAGRLFVHEASNRPPVVREILGTTLEDFVSEEMNTPFHREHGCPFRPFVLNNSGSHHLGIIYHHWIADSASIRLLMREWFARIYQLTPRSRKPFPSPAGGYWRHFGPAAAKWNLLTHVFRGVSWQSRMKRVCRIEAPGFHDFKIRFSMHALPDGLIQRVRLRAHGYGATVNDVFLAEIATVCRRHVPVHENRKRRELALGSIVDLRGQSTHTLEGAFGLFLGFSNIVLRRDVLNDPSRLLDAIALQSRAEKQSHAAEASILRMLAGVIGLRMLKGDRRRIIDFYRKRIPLAAGISNVNLNSDWPAVYHPDPLERYIRISPTGPMMPLVFTPTTLGSTCHFGLTVREALIPPTHEDHIASDFLEALRRFGQ